MRHLILLLLPIVATAQTDSQVAQRITMTIPAGIPKIKYAKPHPTALKVRIRNQVRKTADLRRLTTTLSVEKRATLPYPVECYQWSVKYFDGRYWVMAEQYAKFDKLSDSIQLPPISSPNLNGWRHIGELIMVTRFNMGRREIIAIDGPAKLRDMAHLLPWIGKAKGYIIPKPYRISKKYAHISER